jgi:protoheme IX farnesyltransferase
MTGCRTGFARAPWPVQCRAFLELTKPRIVLLVLVTTALGFCLGAAGEGSWAALAWTLAGTALAAGGAAALNNYLERDADACMARTKRRPLPRGVIEPAGALAFGVTLVLSGVAILVLRVNLPAAFLVLLAAFLYVLVYTPLKKLTWLSTSVGAIPGALPPISGWVAAAGDLDAGAWVLFAVLFAWQHPHFYSIGWMFREDYRRAGFRMLPATDGTGHRTFRQVLFFSAALVAASMALGLTGRAGAVYLAGALVAGLFVLGVSVRLSVTRSLPDARRLLRMTIVYLPVLLALILLDAG